MRPSVCGRAVAYTMQSVRVFLSVTCFGSPSSSIVDHPGVRHRVCVCQKQKRGRRETPWPEVLPAAAVPLTRRLHMPCPWSREHLGVNTCLHVACLATRSVSGHTRVPPWKRSSHAAELGAGARKPLVLSAAWAGVRVGAALSESDGARGPRAWKRPCVGSGTCLGRRHGACAKQVHGDAPRTALGV